MSGINPPNSATDLPGIGGLGGSRGPIGPKGPEDDGPWGSLDNKVAKIHRFAISTFVETAITLASCVSAVLLLTGAPIFLPCIISGIALTISAIYMARIYYQSRKRYPVVADDSLNKVISTLNKSINDSINSDFSSIINAGNHKGFAEEALDSALEESDPELVLLAQVDAAYKRNEDSRTLIQKKFLEIKGGFESQYKRLQKGHPALIDEVISELYQRNALLRVINLLTKSTSITLKLLKHNTSSKTKDVFNNYKDLIGFQRLCFNWFDIGFKYQRCYLRDQEIEFLRFYRNHIQSLITNVQKDYPETCTYLRQKFLEPLSHHLDHLEKSNQQKKKKQIIAGITSSIDSIDALVNLGKSTLNPQKHAKTLKFAERTSSSLSLFGSVMSFGVQIGKITKTCKQANNVKKELRKLTNWQKTYAPFWDPKQEGQLPADNNPVWNDWKNNWSAKLSREEYFVGMESMRYVVSARIDVLKATKKNCNRKTTYNSFKMLLSTSKAAIAAKEVLEVFGLIFIHLVKAFAVANLIVSLAGLAMQVGKYGYKFWKGRHTVKYYQAILRINSQYRKNRAKLTAKEKELHQLCQKIEQNKAGNNLSNELQQVERLIQEITKLESNNREIKQDLYNKKRAYKDSLLQECFYSYKKDQVQELLQKLGDFPFRAEDSNFQSDNKPHELSDNTPHGLIVAQMRQFGVYANNLGKREILNFIRK